MTCLYQLQKTDYEYYSKKFPYGAECRCSLCIYGRKRVEAKGTLPRKVYESDLFQESLRMLNGRPHKRIVITEGELDEVISAILGLRE